MKKILSLFLVIIATTLSLAAQETTKNNSSQKIKLEYTHHNESTSRHRAPFYANLEVFYNAECGNINIYYDGEATGEVFLYLNDNLIEYDTEINTSFPISVTGLYKIAIVTDNWIATGYLSL